MDLACFGTPVCFVEQGWSDTLTCRISFRIFWKMLGYIIEENDARAVAVLSNEKEGHEGQK